MEKDMITFLEDKEQSPATLEVGTNKVAPIEEKKNLASPESSSTQSVGNGSRVRLVLCFIPRSFLLVRCTYQMKQPLQILQLASPSAFSNEILTSTK